MEKVYLVFSIYENGRRFEGDVHVEAYDDKDSAKIGFSKLKEVALLTFQQAYDKEDIEVEEIEDGANIMVSSYDDYWEGYIQETEVKHGVGNTMNKEITLTFDIYEGRDGKTYFVEKYKEVESGKSLYRYGYGSTDNWTTVQEGLTSKPNLKHLHLK